MSRRDFLGVFGGMFLFAVSAWASEPNQAEEQAIAAIKKAGGEIRRETASPTAPVIAVRFGCHSEATDAEIVLLKCLPDLQELVIVGKKVTDKGLEPLQNLSKLQSLVLNCTSATDTTLGRLKGLTSLKKVYIRYSNVTEQGIKDLAKALPDTNIKHIPLP